MKIQIVDAKPEDAKAIGYIQSQTWLCSYANPKKGIVQEDIEEKVAELDKKGFKNIAKKIVEKNSHNFVAKDKDKIVGFIAAHKDKTEGKIEALHVLPKYQGQGIGKSLMQKALDWIGDVEKITVEVVEYNEPAKRFYQLFGFKERSQLSKDPINLPGGKLINKILMVKTSFWC